MNISDPGFISYPTHQLKAVNNPPPPVKVPNKDNPICVHISDALNINNYFIWGNSLGELMKLINATLFDLFYDHKFCGAWWKSKYSVAN